MPELPKPKRRQLKMVPDVDGELAALVAALERIASGVADIVTTLDSIIVDDGAPARVRVESVK